MNQTRVSVHVNREAYPSANPLPSPRVWVGDRVPGACKVRRDGSARGTGSAQVPLTMRGPTSCEWDLLGPQQQQNHGPGPIGWNHGHSGVGCLLSTTPTNSDGSTLFIHQPARYSWPYPMPKLHRRGAMDSGSSPTAHTDMVWEQHGATRVSPPSLPSSTCRGRGPGLCIGTDGVLALWEGCASPVRVAVEKGKGP